MGNENNVPYMKEYLRYALYFERNIYIWKKALQEVNARLNEASSTLSALENNRSGMLEELSSLDVIYESQRRYNESETKKYKKRAGIFICLFIITIVVLFLISLYITGNIYPDDTVLNAEDTVMKAVYPFLITGGMFFYTLVGPICLVLFFVNRSKYKKIKSNIDPTVVLNAQKRREGYLKEQESEAANNLKIITSKQALMLRQKQEIETSLQSARRTLDDIYSKNVLYKDYRGLVEVATLYQYLDSGRCNTIQGHGGIYDTYENDLRANIIIKNLQEINARLADIQKNQKVLYRELQRASSILSDIRSDIGDIRKFSSETASNTAISASANQQSAEANKWMAWHR